MSEEVKAYGWTAVPRDSSILLNERKNVQDPTPQTVHNTNCPHTPLIKAITEYARTELPEPTFNHSMRVYYYGKAIAAQHFPAWSFTDETYLLACLLHDIGTTDKNLHATLLSFEFYGGMLALDLLQNQHHAPKTQAESVAEAIFRHQDLGESGKITTIGALIQFATIFGNSGQLSYLDWGFAFFTWLLLPRNADHGIDNMGQFEELVHRDTIEDVVKRFPRKGWSSCFAATIRKENGLKPWAHTTKLGEEDFPEGVLGNRLMAPYDA